MWGLSPQIIQGAKSAIWAAPFVAACVMGYMFLQHLTDYAEDEAKRNVAWLAWDKEQHAKFMKAFADQNRKMDAQSLSLKEYGDRC